MNTPLVPPTRRGGFGPVSWLLGLLLATSSLSANANEGSGWQRDPVLSPLLIQQLVTDAAGLRWAATDEGVYRYDGNEAVPLKSLVRCGPRLRVELVSALAFDRAGRLWIGSESGLLRFEPATGRLLAVPLPLGRDESPRVKALLYDPRTDRVWVGYGAGAVVLLAAARPQRTLFPVCRVADSECYFTAETGGTAPGWPTTVACSTTLLPTARSAGRCGRRPSCCRCRAPGPNGFSAAAACTCSTRPIARTPCAGGRGSCPS